MRAHWQQWSQGAGELKRQWRQAAGSVSGGDGPHLLQADHSDHRLLSSAIGRNDQPAEPPVRRKGAKPCDRAWPASRALVWGRVASDRL